MLFKKNGALPNRRVGSERVVARQKALFQRQLGLANPERVPPQTRHELSGHKVRERVAVQAQPVANARGKPKVAAVLRWVGRGAVRGWRAYRWSEGRCAMQA